MEMMEGKKLFSSLKSKQLCEDVREEAAGSPPTTPTSIRPREFPPLSTGTYTTYIHAYTHRCTLIYHEQLLD